MFSMRHILLAACRTLGGLVLLAGQRIEDLPITPSALLMHSQGKWSLTFSKEGGPWRKNALFTRFEELMRAQ